jgi:acyl-homoserine-lactone acylase
MYLKSIISALCGILFLQMSLWGQINPKDVTIIRDQYGVPHIYGKTDADMVYGLAWAACEDDFGSMQENFMAVRGKLASVKGKEGAIMDVLAHIVQARETADRLYNEKSYSSEFQKILKAYVQSLNDYAMSHKEEWFKGVGFPVTEKDIVAAHVLAVSIITNVQYDIIRSMDGNISLFEVPQTAGSNAFAANSAKTADGNTYLCLNSHQPLTGPYAWYEAHINSEESGINMHGATFPGGMTLFIGVNEYLGWSHTINYPDHVDTYKLKTRKEGRKVMYELDGQWFPLEKYPIHLKVKAGPIKLPITKKFYKSKHGTVIKNKKGYYAIRFRANMDIRAAEQWYWMNRAQNLDEFKKALALQYIPGTNVVYADRDDNIFLVSLGNFPQRDKTYDWSKVLPGNKEALIWGEECRPITELPQITNPKAGYLYNTNNPPFNCTAAYCCINADDTDLTFGYQTKENNRGIRSRYLFDKKEKITYQDFKDIKYDNYYHTPLYTASIEGIEQVFNLDPAKYPKIAESIKLLKLWDRKTDPDRKAAIASITLYLLIDDLFKKGAFPGVAQVSEAYVVEFVTKGQKHLKKHFGKVDVTIGELQRLVRGDKDYPVGGMPDVLAAMNFEKGKKGRLEAFLGDSFIQFAKWTPDGVQIEAVNAYGASNKPGNPHYDDQVPMYLNQELRPVYLDKTKVMESMESMYHPGTKRKKGK